jgi:glycosyltransferase involved in cell wall biosynthesis
MKIDLIFLTHNRLEYTRLALQSVLANPEEDFALTIWDNASTDGTVDYLKSVKDPRLKDIVFSKQNVPQTTAVGQIWQASKADLLGKLDNDCLLPHGWLNVLTQAHQDIPEFGCVACWPFFADDFDHSRAKSKIQQFGRHQILRHPWTCGTGFLLKRRMFEEVQPLEGGGMTGFLIKGALKGYINGFYYPLLFQDHMDDPKSSHCRIRTQEAFEAAKKVTAVLQYGRFTNLDGYMKFREAVVGNLLDDTFDPRSYVGWRDRMRRAAKWINRKLQSRNGKPADAR